MHHIGMSTAPALYPNLAYKPLEDFKTVGLVTNVPMTIVARKDFEPNTLQRAGHLREGERRQGHHTPMPESAPPPSSAAC